MGNTNKECKYNHPYEILHNYELLPLNILRLAICHHQEPYERQILKKVIDAKCN